MKSDYKIVLKEINLLLMHYQDFIMANGFNKKSLKLYHNVENSILRSYGWKKEEFYSHLINIINDRDKK